MCARAAPPGRASPPTHAFLASPAVVPALPLVAGAETMETSPPTTTIRWRRQTLLENVHCEERHKATGTPAWHVRQPGDPQNLPPCRSVGGGSLCELPPVRRCASPGPAGDS